MPNVSTLFCVTNAKCNSHALTLYIPYNIKLPNIAMVLLLSVVQIEWERIPVEECQKLIESMPRRIQTVRKAKGGYTKY